MTGRLIRYDFSLTIKEHDMAHGESLRLRNIQPTPRWHHRPDGTPIIMPPSVRRSYRGMPKQAPSTRKAKGIPKWHLRRAGRTG